MRNIKAFYYPLVHGWSIWCFVCATAIEGPCPPGMAYHTVGVVTERARRHLVEHATGAIRP